MKDFFISYTAADKEWAAWIAWTLEEAGYSVVLQAWDFLPGMNFVLEMQRAIRESSRTLLVLSDNYLNAEYTYPEWAAAFAADPKAEQRKLIPVRIDNCRPPGLLSAIVYVDLHDCDKEQAQRELVSAIINRRKPDSPPDFPGKPGATPVRGPVAGRAGAVTSDESVQFKPSSLGTLQEATRVWSLRHFSHLIWGTEGRSGANWEGERQRRYITFAAQNQACQGPIQTLSRCFPVRWKQYSPLDPPVLAYTSFIDDRPVFAYEVRISTSLIAHNGLKLPAQVELRLPSETQPLAVPDGADAPLRYTILPQQARHTLRPGESLEVPLTLAVGIDFEHIYQLYANDLQYAGDLYDLGRRHLKAGRAFHRHLQGAGTQDGAIAIGLDVVFDDGSTRQVPLDIRVTQGHDKLPAWDGDAAAVLGAIDRIEELAKPAFDDEMRRAAQKAAEG